MNNPNNLEPFLFVCYQSEYESKLIDNLIDLLRAHFSNPDEPKMQKKKRRCNMKVDIILCIFNVFLVATRVLVATYDESKPASSK